MTARRLLTVLQVNLRLCLIEIGANPTRSVISSLGIFLGTASLLVNLTFVRGMEADIQTQMEQMGGASLVTVRQIEPQDRREAVAFTRSGGLRAGTLHELAGSLEGVERVLPVVDLRWQYLRFGSRGTGSRVSAVSPGHGGIYNYVVRKGRDLEAGDFEQRRRVCLLGMELSRRLFDGETEALGQRVTLRGVPFTVVGILDAKDRFDRRGRELHLPWDTWAVTLGTPSVALSEAAIKIRHVDEVDAVVAALERGLLAAHRGVQDFEIEVNRDKIAEMRRASLGMRVLILAIAVISLTVGAVSIMNTMFGTIGDRIREIGVRKALGAQRIDVLLQFLAEAVLLSLVGGVPGLVLGISFTRFPEGTFPFTPRLEGSDWVVTLLFVLLAGVVSGLFPALKASEMEPVEALRF